MAHCLHTAAELKSDMSAGLSRHGAAAHAQPCGIEPQELQPVRGHRPVVQRREPAAAGRRPGDGVAGAERVVAAPTADGLRIRVTGVLELLS